MDNNFKSIVAQNIYYLRTQSSMTQFELGEKLNYSDKAISKWERGDGIPDAFVEHGTPEQLYKVCGMDKESVLAAIMEFKNL